MIPYAPLYPGMGPKTRPRAVYQLLAHWPNTFEFTTALLPQGRASGGHGCSLYNFEVLFRFHICFKTCVYFFDARIMDSLKFRVEPIIVLYSRIIFLLGTYPFPITLLQWPGCCCCCCFFTGWVYIWICDPRFIPLVQPCIPATPAKVHLDRWLDANQPHRRPPVPDYLGEHHQSLLYGTFLGNSEQVAEFFLQTLCFFLLLPFPRFFWGFLFFFCHSPPPASSRDSNPRGSKTEFVFFKFMSHFSEQRTQSSTNGWVLGSVSSLIFCFAVKLEVWIFFDFFSYQNIFIFL